MDINTHAEALRIGERYGYGIFDALMIAAALRAKRTVRYSDDVQDGMTIGQRLLVVDPYGDP